MPAFHRHSPPVPPTHPHTLAQVALPTPRCAYTTCKPVRQQRAVLHPQLHRQQQRGEGQGAGSLTLQATRGRCLDWTFRLTTSCCSAHREMAPSGAALDGGGAGADGVAVRCGVLCVGWLFSWLPIVMPNAPPHQPPPCRLWSMEVRANLSVYRGHQLPGRRQLLGWGDRGG